MDHTTGEDKLAIDIEEIFRVLNEIMPYIAKQKMRLDQERKIMQMYLDRELEIMRRRAGYREEEQFRGRDISRDLGVLGTFLKSLEGLARPELEMRRRAPLSGIETGLPPHVPEEYEAEMAPIEDIMQYMTKAFEEGKFMVPEKVALATRILPLKTITERPLELEKAKAGREQQRLREEEIKLGREELEAKKKGELPDKELKKTLDKLINRRDKARLDAFDEEEANKLTKQINALYKKLGEKSEKDYEEAATGLKAKGYTSENIEQYPDVVKKIESKGFKLWVLMGYL